jgi:hypothetical protein
LAQKYPQASFHGGSEDTGIYWRNIFSFFRRRLPWAKLSLINPLQTRRFKELELARVKTDATDARASGRSIRGKKAPYVTYGYSKDHRSDLKQLLFILTITRDGEVPVQFRCEAGSGIDSRTHEETWEALARATGRSDFLYVADSKLCNSDAMEHIAKRHGRFVTVLPKSRFEDSEFREWIQGHEPDWEKVWDRENPRKKGGPRDRWYVTRYRLPSQEGWPVIWVYSSLLRLRQAASRQERIARAEQELADLAAHHPGPRPKKRSRLRGAEADRRGAGGKPRQALHQGNFEVGLRAHLQAGEAGKAGSRHQVQKADQEALEDRVESG